MKNIKNVILLLLLTILWISCSMVYFLRSDVSISLLVFPEWRFSTIVKSSDTGKATHKLTGMLTAREENLGIIFVRSSLNRRLIKEKYIITFRIRPSGTEQWYFQSSQRMSPVLSYYPFGFPVIPHSKGILYEYEIETQSINYIQNVQPDILKPVTLGGYKIDTSQLTYNDKRSQTFALKKLMSWIENFDYLSASFLFFLPNLFVLFQTQIEQIFESLIRWVSRRKNLFPFARLNSLLLSVIENYKRRFVLLTLFAFLIDTFVIEGVSELVILFISIVWIHSIRKYSLSPLSSFKFAYYSMFLTVLMIIFDSISPAQNTATWFFIFMVIGVIQSIIAFRKKRRYEK